MGCLCSQSRVRWKKILDHQTVNEAWKTYNQLTSSNISFRGFEMACERARKQIVSYDELRFLRLENLSRKILNANTLEEAFQGELDKLTVEFLIKTKLQFNPIVFYQRRSTLVLLDGVHRIVAAHLRCLLNARIHILIIGLGDLNFIEHGNGGPAPHTPYEGTCGPLILPLPVHLDKNTF